VNSQTNICIFCQREYIIKKQGVVVVEIASFGPYKLWNADLKECPGCGHLMIGGVAKDVFIDHDDIFKAFLEKNAYVVIDK
jgi:hypothetical protein